MIAPSSYHDMRGSCSSAVLWCQQWTWGVIVGCWQDSPSGRRSQRWRGNSSTQRQPRTVSTVPPTQTFPPRRHPATSEAPIDYRLAGSSCAAVSSPMALGVRAISVREGSREKRKKKTRSAPNSGAAGAWGTTDALTSSAGASTAKPNCRMYLWSAI